MSSEVLGVVILFRHGDREGFYQSPTSYTPSDTVITPLGEQQEYQLGQLLRSRYLDPSSPNAIQGFNATLLNDKQVHFSADAGGEGSVIFDSTIALTQGAFPATTLSNTTLANGTTIVSPLAGYQYVSIESVEPEQDISLEGWVECPAYTADNKAWYASEAFKAQAEVAAPFLSTLGPIVGGRNVTLENMWNVFDYINVNYIHSASFMQATGENIWRQARAWANWHEYTSFSDSSPTSIGNVAGRTILPVIVEALNDIRNSSNPMVFRGIGISYKPFISLFNMTQVAQTYPEVAGVVNYAAALAFELRRETVTDSYTVTLTFKNGSEAADFTALNMFGSASPAYSLDEFIQTVEPYGISSLGQWCNECGNTETRGCDLVAEYNSTTSYNGPTSTIGRQHTSPLAAGFIGALVALALGAAVLAGMWRMGMIMVGRRGTRQKAGRHSRIGEAYALPAYDTKISTMPTL